MTATGTQPRIDQLTVGTTVLRDNSFADIDFEPEIGTVVEPTPAELKKARAEQCGFEVDDLDEGDGCVLVSWALTAEPDVVTHREWMWCEQLLLDSRQLTVGTRNET